jgi:fumarate reductase flavoprotein subunit
MQVSQVIIQAAQVRENSRGAHYREDFQDAGDLHGSTYTCATLEDDQVVIQARPVEFTRVAPGQSLLKSEPEPERAQTH